MKHLGILTVFLVILAVPPVDYAERLKAVLISYEGVPAGSTVARGEFRAQVSPDEQSIDYELTYRGLQGTLTQAHIHAAQRGVDGSIVIWLCGTATNTGPEGTQTCPQDGTITETVIAVDAVAGSMTSQQPGAGELAGVIAAIRASVAYANVHTSPLSPGGEIRSQIKAFRH